MTDAGRSTSGGASIDRRVASAFVKADTPVLSLDLDARDGGARRDRATGSRCGGRLLAAAVAVIASAVAAAAHLHAGGRELVSGAGAGQGPVRVVEASGEAVDPTLVDYLFPVDGDAWTAAKVRVGVAAARAKAVSVGRCVRERGFPGVESLLVENAEEVGTAVMMHLPSLSVIAQYWGDRVPPSDTSARHAFLDCKGIDRSEASEWEHDAKALRSLDHLPPAIAKVETMPVWAEARACMTEAGAPRDAPEARRAYLERVAGETGEALSNPPPGFTAYVSWIYDLPSALAFVWCMTPFFAEVEQELQGPRAEFIERNRAQLLELQRRFEAFAGPGG